MDIDPAKLELMEKTLRDFREDLADSLSREVASSMLKTKYLDVLSHQLRTPVSAIRFNLEMMLENKQDLPEEMAETMEALLENVLRIVLVLNDIVLAQEIEKGTLVVRSDEADLVEVVQHELKEYQSMIEAKNLQVEMDLPDSLIFSFDKHKLENIVSHLIRNAVYYSNEGGKVKISLQDGDEVTFTVEDQGIGIATTDKEFLFDRFYRGKMASEMFTDSSGLGLFIAQKFAKALKSDIFYESEEGKGAKFWLVLAK